MEEEEKRLKQEDCSEDSLGTGILTLTNKRIAFDKTQSRIMDFSKRFGDTVIDVSLGDIQKVCFTANTKEGEKTYKFGVFNTGDWVDSIEDAREEFQ